MISQQLSRFATHENSAYPQLWLGCVGAWCPSLGPSGASLHDYSRRMNWGTLLNMDPATDWVISGGAYALDFDAVNDGIDCGEYVPTGGACSVSAWVQRTGVPLNNNAIVAAKGGLQGDGNSTFALYYNTVLGWSWFVVDASNALAIVRSNTSTSTGVWYFVCGVASSAATTIYIDGQQRNAASGGVAKSSSHVLKIASLTDSVGTYGGNLMIDDLRIYNRALSFHEQLLLSRRRGIAFTPRARASGTPEQAAAATNTLTVSNATLNLTGQSSSLILSRKLLASNGSLNLAGQTSSLSLSRSLSTSKADLNISGQSSLLQVARLLSASNGTIEFSGQSADLRLFRNLSVNNASLSLSGQSATIYAARSLTVDHADVNLSGQVVTLSAGKTLTVNNGELQFAGQQVNLTTQRNLTIANTDIELSSQSVSMRLTTQQNLTVSNASIEVQGQQVTLRLAKSLVVLPAEIQSSGQTAQLTVARKLAVQNGDVDLAGQDVMVRRRFELGIGEGQVSFSGEGIGLLSSRKILATEGRVQFSGQAVQIYPTFQNPVQIFGGNLRFIDKTTGSLRFIQEITR